MNKVHLSNVFCAVSCDLVGFWVFVDTAPPPPPINGCGEILTKTQLNHTRQHKKHQVSELYLSGYILAHFGGHKVETVGFMRHFQRSLKMYR